MAKGIVSFDDVSMTYHSLEGETKTLEKISFNVEAGEFIGIVGPSGCGKTTILSLIAGLIAPTSGDVYVDGKKVNGPSPLVGYMLQQDHLFEWRTIWQNVMLGLEIQNKVTSQNIDKVNKLLDIYGLGEFKNHYPHQLSGGMRQRVALIRTLAIDPKILLLDEPFSALDYQTRLAVSDEVGTIIKKENKTALLVTHDIAEAISMADRVIVLTKRPAKIKSIHTINLTCQDHSPIKCRQAPEFRQYFNKIWEELDIHVQ
ncbi:MAG: ABC transporter ATP-binding protein [Xylanivirga thermophila]|jgi:NitT/TauT family transport system ATP-binding protein|uniref:ABC transporter ATP-binding protein n=1 Tax=Xylanivirga thermophila TaxID=2496273 RepID=UPI00101BCBC1|nr:ABC transporter ATP-binding protein [Xylanivirga thermophila]